MSDDTDELDRRLIGLLQANARLPAATLARKLGVARTTVVARLARLERTGVIKGYGLRLGRPGPEAGVRSLCALQVEPKAGPSVVRRLAGLPEIEQLVAVSGVWDYMATVVVDRVDELDRVLDAIGAIDGIRQTTSAILLATKFDRR
jgi:DNA-binding Lrp family transcriptional regulator